jgi:ubiquinone/menaquinone biosynthesis C-methylase UbiE
MLDSTFNQKRAEAFAESLVDVLNKSAVALALSLGHRAGLFDAMAKLPVAATSAQIADAANLNERYVREWLNALVTGRVVSYDPEAKTYQLPPEHAAFLTRGAAQNLALTMQFIPILAGVEDRVLDCFRHGGGVPYSEFPRFHEVMAEQSGQTVVNNLIAAILPLVPGLKEKLEAGIDVLDVGCGSGRAINLLARNFPNSRFKGCDFSAEGIGAARDEAEKLGLTNARFEIKDAAAIGEAERYDLITAFDAIHDQARPDAVLREIYRALRPNGTFLMQDIAGSSHVHRNLDHPAAPLMYMTSCMHCMTVSLAQGGAGLGTMWGEEKACEMLQEAGFSGVSISKLEHDLLNAYYVVAKT